MQKSRSDLSGEALAQAIAAGDFVALSQAITLIESSRTDHQDRAQALLTALLPRTGGAVRIGITGIPGVGKSTFINAFGQMLCAQDHRVAVLAVDPTSSKTGGSILGDKTRMPDLAANERAFIRPSPTSGALGGVTRHTRESLLLCEAAGFDVILVETVGVGQSEIAVADMVDFFLVLAMPGAGDELQGLKKGVLELADLIAVNKADGTHRSQAERTAAQYRSAFGVLTPTVAGWSPQVVLSSGVTGEGLDAIWRLIDDHRQHMTASGQFLAKRREQQVRWMWALVDAAIHDRLRSDDRLSGLIGQVAKEVEREALTPVLAANRIVDAFWKTTKPKRS